MIIDAEKAHEEWFDMAQAYAWSFRGKSDIGYVMKPTVEEYDAPTLGNYKDFKEPESSYHCIKTIRLPTGATKICYEMTKGSMALPMSSTKITGIVGMKMLPWTTFCLYDLLSAAYPRNVITGRLKDTVGSFFLGGWDQDVDSPENSEIRREFSNHRRFVGIGIILMREIRLCFDPFLSEKDLLLHIDRESIFLSLETSK